MRLRRDRTTILNQEAIIITNINNHTWIPWVFKNLSWTFKVENQRIPTGALIRWKHTP